MRGTRIVGECSAILIVEMWKKFCAVQIFVYNARIRILLLLLFR